MISIYSCQKEALITDPSKILSFSTDTLTFDTVFTRLASTTLSFRAINPHAKAINVKQIQLEQTHHQGAFRINIDGVSGNQAKDVFIPPKDSIFIFVELTVDPTDENNPFIIGENVSFTFNGVQQKVHLRAWGQNAYFHFNDSTNHSTTWANDRPHIIIGQNGHPGFIVKQRHTLTIQPNTRIYASTRSGLHVKGQLHSLGDVDAPVLFEGIRQEDFFDNLPGQWQGIYIYQGSQENVVKHTHIREAQNGLWLGFPSDTSKPFALTANNKSSIDIQSSIIHHCFENALRSDFSDVQAANTLFHNAGDHLLNIHLGGTHFFDHCTFYHQGSIQVPHKLPVIQISNQTEKNTRTEIAPLQAQFKRSIISGTLNNELSLSDKPKKINCAFDYCLIKTSIPIFEDERFSNILHNVDPLFVDPNTFNFRLQSTSFCIDASPEGKNIDLEGTHRPIDIKQNLRSFDLGVYESDS